MAEIEVLDEYDEACPMEKTFCRVKTIDEYETETVEETDKAIKDLVDYLEKNPESYSKILRRKKVEEMENGGMYSYLKVKMMSILHGEQYPACLVPPEEAQNHLNQLKRGMKRVFEYSQENRATRSSARIAARKPLSDASPRLNTPVRERSLRSTKRLRAAASPLASPVLVPVAKIQPSSTPSIPPPPPPPPPPPQLNVTKIRQPNKRSPKSNPTSPADCENSDNEFVTPPSDTRPLRKHRRTVSNSSTTSTSSLTSIHSELVSSNPLKRLRSTQVIRSPGGTPVRPPSEKEHLAHSEPLHKALISVMRRKFRNTRTPSPRAGGHSNVTSPNSTAAFSPLAFSP